MLIAEFSDLEGKPTFDPFELQWRSTTDYNKLARQLLKINEHGASKLNRVRFVLDGVVVGRCSLEQMAVQA